MASSVTEEEKKQGLSPKAQKFVKKVLDPNAGLSKKEIASGKYEQLKTVSPEEAHQMGVSMDKADAERKAMIKELRAKAKANSKPSTSQPKEEPKQLPLFGSKEELINKLRSAIDETIEDTVDKNIKDKNKRQELHNKVMLNKHAEITQAADRRAEYFKGDPKYNTERNQTFTQASPYNDALDQINRNRENKNSYEDSKRQERGSDSDRIYNKIVKRANEIKNVTPQQKASAGKMNYMNKVHDKMNDKNSKIEQALKTIDEADQVLAQPIVAVQNTGNSTKSAQEANPEVKEPVTMDRLELARALKAKVNNDKKVEV